MFARKESCISSDFSSQGFNLDKSLPFNLSSRNTILVYNCSSVLLLSPLNCSSNSLCQAYSNFSGSDVLDCRTLPFCCTVEYGGQAYSVSLTAKSCSLYRSFVDLDPTLPMDKWPTKAGMELQWALPREPVCQTQEDCDDGNNATCVTDLASTGGAMKRCFCVKPLVWNPISGMCERSKYFEILAIKLSCWAYCQYSFKRR